jgi:nitrite reductase/ring-hydroxylating ferredoxin subunit
MQPLERRAVLKVALGVVLGLDLAPIAAAEDVDARSARPQAGDRLVFAEGERRGEIISTADLQPDGRRVNAFPVDPRSSLIRDGSRLNKILLVRCDPERLSEETRHRAVEGVAAYSAICTHQGCEVGGWDDQTKTLWCPCHDSKYDPRENGRVVVGPAPKRLAALPLKMVDGVLTVAGGFSGPVGFQTR